MKTDYAERLMVVIGGEITYFWSFVISIFIFIIFLEGGGGLPKSTLQVPVVQSSKRDAGHAIQVQNVIYLPHSNTVRIRLQHSKTDQEGKGVVIHLTPTQKTICPVSFIRLYLQLGPACRG